MINPFRDINWHPDHSHLRTFARSLLFGFPLLALVFALGGRCWSASWPVWPLWLGLTGLAVGSLCWLFPLIARPIYLIWYAASSAIGLIVSNAILASIFYFIVTPIGLLLRIFRRDTMRQKWDRSAASYWIPIQPNTDARAYFRQS